MNIVYLGWKAGGGTGIPMCWLQRLKASRTREALFLRMKNQGMADRVEQVRILPMMYFAGMHVRDDLMGEEDSWRACLEEMGSSRGLSHGGVGEKVLVQGPGLLSGSHGFSDTSAGAGT
ncbi:MAG: sirohydrochlorin cobaltochelatase [Desulfotignum sp.]|nr:sirohydrochlorin cobaltochelatase [Desulfotignum sp.]